MFSLDQCNIEDHLVESKMLRKEYSHVTCTQFAHYLNVPIVNPAVQQLFRLYDKVNCIIVIVLCVLKLKLLTYLQDSTGLIDFREYLLGVLGISRSGSTLETFKLACKVSIELSSEDITSHYCQLQSLFIFTIHRHILHKELLCIFCK